MPRSSRPTLSPATLRPTACGTFPRPCRPCSSFRADPTISIGSPFLTIPRSIRPVTTVPRPLIENTSSTDIMNGLSVSRFGSGMYSSTTRSSSLMGHIPARSGRSRRCPSACLAEPRTIGVVSPGKPCLLSSSRSSSSTSSSNSGSSIMSTLFRNTTMLGTSTWRAKQHVFARLRHRTIGGRHHQDRAVHLRRARDHVLDVVAVTGHVHVRIVPLVRLVFHVRNVDRDTARFFFRRVVDLVVGFEFRVAPNPATFVIAAVSVVLPWSMCPIVPTFRCGLLRSNFSFAIMKSP
jgi:hypothetical protein